MLDTALLGSELKNSGFEFYSGVPCSHLASLINYAINDCEYVMAANEGDAVATASGAYLAGKRAVVLFQNSGLTNAISPLTSLNYCFQIPLLGFVSLRGEPGTKDEPQHELMGQITTRFLDDMRIPWEFLADDVEEMKRQVQRASAAIEASKTFFFVVKKGVLSKVALKENPIKTRSNLRRISQGERFTLNSRTEVLEAIHTFKDDRTVFLATTGKTGRELFELCDAPNNLYMVGAMGCVSSLGLGMALAADAGLRVVVIDGDGSLLMRMGSLATNAYYAPNNLLHILLDNNAHDSTGGQFTVSNNVQFVEVAASVGYPVALYAHDLEELKAYIEQWKQNPELTFIHIRTALGSKPELGRPSLTPAEVKDRFMKLIASAKR